MDQHHKSRQPSNRVLLLTAVACAGVLAWAYRDSMQQTRVALPGSSAALDSTDMVEAPRWEPTEVEPELREYHGFDFPSPTPLRLPPPPESVAPTEQDIAPVEPEFPAEDSTADVLEAGDDDWEYESYFTEEELSAKPPELPLAKPGLAEELNPDDLATQEQSVLVQPPVDVAKREPITPIEPAPLDETALLIANTPPEDLLSYTPAAAGISQRIIDDVREAFSLGRHGALHAARLRFLKSMQVVAGAKDAAEGTDDHSTALAEGLAALAEARDFLPGGAVQKELSVAEVAASHHTPLLKHGAKAGKTLPHEAAALYYRYAEQKLAAAVAGEQAGSMALYGLGKTHARLAEVDGSPIDQQKSLVMHRAAVIAHKANYLAANELGVGLAKVGRYNKASDALRQSIAHGGGSTVHRNLAHVQHKLGKTRLASATQQQAERLAVRERAAGEFSRQRGVEWVAPQRMAGRAQPVRPTPLRTAAAPAPPAPESAWGEVKRFAKRVMVGTPQQGAARPGAAKPAQFQPNPTAAPARSQTTYR